MVCVPESVMLAVVATLTGAFTATEAVTPSIRSTVRDAASPPAHAVSASRKARKRKRFAVFIVWLLYSLNRESTRACGSRSLSRGDQCRVRGRDIRARAGLPAVHLRLLGVTRRGARHRTPRAHGLA